MTLRCRVMLTLLCARRLEFYFMYLRSDVKLAGVSPPLHRSSPDTSSRWLAAGKQLLRRQPAGVFMCRYGGPCDSGDGRGARCNGDLPLRVSIFYAGQRQTTDRRYVYVSLSGVRLFSLAGSREKTHVCSPGVRTRRRFISMYPVYLTPDSRKETDPS